MTPRADGMDGRGTGNRSMSMEWAAVCAIHGTYVATRCRGEPMGRHACARALNGVQCEG